MNHRIQKSMYPDIDLTHLGHNLLKQFICLHTSTLIAVCIHGIRGLVVLSQKIISSFSISPCPAIQAHIAEGIPR